MSRLRSAAVVVVFGACVPSLQTHERMGKLSAAALQQCITKADRCAAVLICANAAEDAGAALQAARERIAKGQEDAETAARAAALPLMADAACKSAGVQVLK